MKIQASIRAMHEDRRPFYEMLKSGIDAACNAIKEPRWHYESRIKTLESFSVKVESGRVLSPPMMEDFLACSFVVPNSTSIELALSLIGSEFEIKYRRPPLPNHTRKNADSFPFDDLRLYCVRGNDGSRPKSELDELVFEIQIKTFLQHAWAIATHDLSYKTDDVRWGKDRIVAHLKAAIEYAEISILHADSLSHVSSLQLSHKKTSITSSIIEVMIKNWERNELPKNLRGLAESIQSILTDLKVDPNELANILAVEKKLNGELPSNLSPYGVVIQSLLKHKEIEIGKFLRTRGRSKIVLTPELSLPAYFIPDYPHDRIVVVNQFLNRRHE